MLVSGEVPTAQGGIVANRSCMSRIKPSDSNVNRTALSRRQVRYQNVGKGVPSGRRGSVSTNAGRPHDDKNNLAGLCLVGVR